MRLISGPQGPRAVVDGHPCLLLSSDNYLGIADHPHVREAAADAVLRWGAGAGAARPGSGNMKPHRRLERELAEFTGYEAALVQGPAHMSIAATVAALAGSGELVCSDQLNHPGIAAGCRLSGAETFVYDHGDMEHLAWGLEQAEGRAVLIVTESVFAAEGDLAPLGELAELAGEFDCRLLVDESHAIGTAGPDGRGLVAASGLTGEVDIVLASLAKALGSYGSFIACDRETAEYLSLASDSMACSTALPPSVAVAAGAALELLREHPYRVERLRLNAECLRQALAEANVRTGASESQIFTVPAGDALRLARACDLALASGVMVGSLLPPQLPTGEAAIRLTVMATHRGPELRAAAAAVAAACRESEITAATSLAVVEPGWLGDSDWIEGLADDDATEGFEWIESARTDTADIGPAQELPSWIRAA